ncbi:hypothetical protein PYCC9005_000038 [Savitreella phatthalungensis]
METSLDKNQVGQSEAIASSMEVGSILDELEIETGDPALLCCRLKELTRDKLKAQPLYTDRGLSILLRHSYSQSRNASLEAQRCLANALLLSDEFCLKAFQSSTLIDAALNHLMSLPDEHLKSGEDEFLFCRILFLGTAKCGSHLDLEIMFPALVSVLKAMVDHAASGDWQSSSVTAELLKLLYNLSVYIPTLTRQVIDAEAVARLTLLLESSRQSQSAAICSHVINLMSNLPDNQMAFIRHEVLLSILEISLDDCEQPGGKLVGDQLAPLLTLLEKIHNAGLPSARDAICSRLLVPMDKRLRPLGLSTSVGDRLLAICSGSASSVLREAVLDLLYALSDSDAEQFVRNVGYGHAIGFLMQHGLTISQESLENLQINDGVNAITGQSLAMQRAEKGPSATEHEQMTEEDQEREAERLFVLFQRLRKTGVVDFPDPIRAAVEEGRFAEL